MEGLIGIAGIAVLVMEGVELYQHSSYHTIIAAAVCCIAYIFYKWGDFSKKAGDNPEIKNAPAKQSKPVMPYSPHMDEYIAEYEPEKYDDYCEAYGIPKKTVTETVPVKKIIDAKPTKKTVSETLQTSPTYNPDLDQLPHVFNSGKYILMHLCYNHFAVDLRITGMGPSTINKDGLKYSKFMNAYIRAGSPSFDTTCVFVYVDAIEKDGAKPYIPLELMTQVIPGTDLVLAIQNTIIKLNHFFNEKPCYQFQYS